mmetsp:Transcript_20798/g.38643  ORF Transcript_20798/g.38643 Transcript_20798/m.38643 type:complete len:104 (+) Transcript_20798:109-420(+)
MTCKLHTPAEIAAIWGGILGCINKVQEEAFQVPGLKTCPNCKEGLFRDDGCNFVRCPLENCREFFCWVCLAKLTVEEHYSHFPEGVYGDTCATLDSRAMVEWE